jgi:hypothetical protein
VHYPIDIARGSAFSARCTGDLSPEGLGEILKNLGISTPKKIISVAEPASDPVAALTT